ncbi:O-antigen ligase family protein [Novosphingopyxis iocasae]|uniref:O-antigen ligase family protein n=1 Tax=Novosphingopyxis iocasae TaxID=2762729 RepID=UPI0016518A71|nr:O-antigen ligase family protein [Novosphingopyxis iocasae]
MARRSTPLSAELRARGPLVLMICFLALVALTGGASRADSLAQPFVRVGSIIYVGALVALGWIDWGRARALWPVFAVLALAVLAAAVQLIPLAPSLWTGLPGRAFYEQAAQIAQIAQPARPINLSPDRGWNALFSLVVPVAAAIGLTSLDRASRAQLVMPLIVIIFASAVLGLAQISGGDASPLRWYAITNRSSAVGLFANRNHDATFLAMAFPLMAVWAMQQRDRRKGVPMRGWVALGMGVFLMLMLVTTGSRAGLVLGVLSILLSLAVAVPSLRKAYGKVRRKRRPYYIGGALVLIAGFVAAVMSFQRAAAVQRFMGLGVADEVRASVWPVAWEMTRAFFPIGIGYGAFDPVYRRFEPFANLGTSYVNAVHNDYLQVVLEGGALGAVIIALALIWWLFGTGRLWLQESERNFVPLGRAGSVIILLVALASVVDYPARTPLIMTMLVLAAGWMQLPWARGRALRNTER